MQVRMCRSHTHTHPSLAITQTHSHTHLIQSGIDTHEDLRERGKLTQGQLFVRGKHTHHTQCGEHIHTVTQDWWNSTHKIGRKYGEPSQTHSGSKGGCALRPGEGMNNAHARLSEDQCSPHTHLTGQVQWLSSVEHQL